jgi:hypothetical protein
MFDHWGIILSVGKVSATNRVSQDAADTKN